MVVVDNALKKREAEGNPIRVGMVGAGFMARGSKIDALLEVTGSLEFGAHAVFEAIRHGKHMILMNAELDGTIGPILKVYADKAGVVYTVSDGDQPGGLMTFSRFV